MSSLLYTYIWSVFNNVAVTATQGASADKILHPLRIGREMGSGEDGWVRRGCVGSTLNSSCLNSS
jgi:hypothetical protein